ncbi:TPA: hypothetical protein NV714_000153 [Escherichia coli]|nr:hypothetical protein [Escherichia coli]
MNRTKDFLKNSKNGNREINIEDRYFTGESTKDKFLYMFLQNWKKIIPAIIIVSGIYGISQSEFVTHNTEKYQKESLLSARLNWSADKLNKDIYPNVPNASDLSSKLNTNEANLKRINDLMQNENLEKIITNATGKFKKMLEANGFSIERDGSNKALNFGSSNKYKDMTAEKRREALRQYLTRNPELAEKIEEHIKQGDKKVLENNVSQNNDDLKAMKKKLGM